MMTSRSLCCASALIILILLAGAIVAANAEETATALKTESIFTGQVALPTAIMIGGVVKIDLQAKTIWVDPKMKPDAAAKAMLKALRPMLRDWCVLKKG
jgi:hypothetical protein